MPLTTNYGWEMPDVGGDNGAWGTLLNTLFADIDTDLDAVSDVANAALPKAGGAMTGRVDLHSMTMKRVDKGTINGAQSLDLSAADAFTATLDGNTTFTFANTPAGTFAVGMVLRLTNGGAFTITWPASLDVAGGSMPALTAAGTDLLAFITFDGGTTWMLAGYQIDVR